MIWQKYNRKFTKSAVDKQNVSYGCVDQNMTYLREACFTPICLSNNRAGFSNYHTAEILPIH